MKKKYLKTVNSEKKYYVDKETGEIIEMKERKDKILVNTKEDFFITFAEVLGLYKELTGVQIKILTWLMLNQSRYNSNMAVVTGVVKEKISNEMNISISSINNAIPELVKKNILIRQGGKRSATYLINPEYFWKGDLRERNRKLKFILEIELDIKNNKNFDKK